MVDFKYDVAFSFLKEDEELAAKVNDLIQNQLQPFFIQKDKARLLAQMVRRHLINGIHLGASPEPCSAASGGVLDPKGIKFWDQPPA